MPVHNESEFCAIGIPCWVLSFGAHNKYAVEEQLSEVACQMVLYTLPYRLPFAYTCGTFHPCFIFDAIFANSNVSSSILVDK